LALSKDREVEYCAAYAMALSGEVSQAQRMADDLARRFPQNTVVRFSYLPVLRATECRTVGEDADRNRDDSSEG
jgi:outer membrane protein assembly factor BamD (BamD/ComL family)